MRPLRQVSVLQCSRHSPSPARSLRRLAPCRWNSSQALDFDKIDAKWQPRWKDNSLWTNSEAPKGKFFAMPMFPYPSGALHIGHLRNYTISDVIARYRRMAGYHVLHPIGWDAFGLPAENAAIERGLNPADWTLRNIEKMKQQIEAMGGCWDWDRELRTCDPVFYKDTQRIFLKLYENGLAYQKEAMVNYDPVDKTVLANEQVDANGFSWRSGAKVEQRKLKQWFIRITAYAQELLDDLALLEQDAKWPPRVVAMQKNWLGRSEGATLAFSIVAEGDGQFPVPVFTTRPDTMFGVQYIAFALDHYIVQRQLYDDHGLREFMENAPNLDPDTKAGYRMKAVTADSPLVALHPHLRHLRGLPVFAAPYVKSDYGSGAVMGVPAHDARDAAFWKKNRLSEEDNARTVILPQGAEQASENTVFTERGVLSKDCGGYAGMKSRDAANKIVQDLAVFGDAIARDTTNWRMRDWLVSRQRYWGTPIPIIHCTECGPVPIPESDLPVELPILSDEQWKGLKGNPLETHEDWVNVECPKCHKPARRETDTMDTFVDSSWYYLRFAETQHSDPPFMPVDLYIGGVEHAILHLLYARFISKFLAEVEGRPELREPFAQLLTQGMVHGKTYADPDTGRFLKPDDLDLANADSPVVKASGKPATVSFEKMSKSKHNGVDPLACMATYGADTTRAHLLFQAPVSEVLDWDEAKITGIQRWFGRLWSLANKLSDLAIHYRAGEPLADLSGFSDQGLELARQTQLAISSITQSYSETYALNTIVSDLMSLTNLIQQSSQELPSVRQPEQYLIFSSYRTLLRMLTPIAPSFAEECWATLHCLDSNAAWSASTTASKSGFPTPDGSLDRLQVRMLPCAVQVKGKLRFVTQIPPAPPDLVRDALKEWVIAQVRATPECQAAEAAGRLDPGKARKVIVVRGGRTVNFVPYS